MSLISFPFDFGLLKNNIFNDATPSSYIPPGYSSGLRATYSYTVPAATKTLVNFNLNASGLVQNLGTNKDVTTIFNRSMTLTFPGAANDVFVGFSESYSNASSIVYNFVILKNGVTVFSLTQSFSDSTVNKKNSANLLIQCLEYNQ
jgi:hypothetical protein